MENVKIISSSVKTVSQRWGCNRCRDLVSQLGYWSSRCKTHFACYHPEGDSNRPPPTLSRRFRTNDRQLRYRRLPVDMFTDTMISKTLSRRGNKCAQIFATADGWTRAYPMERKSQAHEALSLLHQREGVPNIMIMDGSKEQTLGQFCKKCRQAGSHVKQTKAYSQWSNAAERFYSRTEERRWSRDGPLSSSQASLR